MTTDGAAAGLADRFRRQADAAVLRVSPLYDALLRGCVADIVALGPTWELLEERVSEPSGDALPLRLLASVHRLVLGGEPTLAPYYPSVGGRDAPQTAWPVFRTLLEDRAADLRPLLDRPLQTNEVRRCTPLLVGLARVCDRTGLPPAVLEIGASAGLNLNWHRFRYEGAEGRWGPGDSPVRLTLPPDVPVLPPALTPVVEGRGCDRTPLDVREQEDRLWLRSCIWADQTDRLALLDVALAVAEEHPPAVDASDAAPWLEHRLAESRPGSVTVVVQTIVQQYLGTQQAEAVAAVVEAAGREARADAPVAWLRMEPPDDEDRLPPDARGLAELRVRLWPGGADRLLAYTGYHGRPVQLLPRS